MAMTSESFITMLLEDHGEKKYEPAQTLSKP